jgi:hypothetical protein
MKVVETISRRKKLFDLPLRKEELEYWGPLNHHFSNSFLTMGNKFLQAYFESISVKTIKKIFTAFVELVQNVAEYSEEKFQNNFPQSYVNLKVEGDEVVIKTANIILTEDVHNLTSKFNWLLNLEGVELDQAHKKALIHGESLGLIMIRKMKNANFDWEIIEQNEEHWLTFELRIRYEETTD